MRISKLYLVACAAALCGPFTLRANDSPAQAAARAALEEKMRELNAQPTPSNAQTPPPVKPEKAVQPAAPAAPATSPPVQNPPVAAPATPQQPAPVAVTPSGAQPSTNPPAAVPTAPPAQPVKKAVATTAPAATPRTKEHTSTTSQHDLFSPVPPPSGGRSIEVPSDENAPTSNPAMQPKTSVQTPPPAPVQQPVYTGHHENPNAPYPGQKLGLKPIEPPPLPITSAQQAELEALLEKYEASAITPEEYQAERAKILAEHQ